MALYLGVDGGQSSTKALIGDETGRVLGSGTGGPGNHVGAAEGAAKLARAVGESVGLACEQAGLDARGVRFDAAGFAFFSFTSQGGNGTIPPFFCARLVTQSVANGHGYEGLVGGRRQRGSVSHQGLSLAGIMWQVPCR